MINKKILSMLLVILMFFGNFSILSFAKNTVTVDVYMTDTYIGDDDLLYKSGYTIIDRMFDVAVRINGLENISVCDFMLEFNDEVLKLENDSISYESSDINYMPMSYSEASDNQISVHIFDDKCIARPDMFVYAFRFSALKKGELGINLKIKELLDGNGNSYDADINVNLPDYTYGIDEIPNALPDFETSLSYGFSSFIKTELAYPMTVGEFSEKMQNAENCAVIIKNREGTLLKEDEIIPTGAELTVLFDKMIVFESTFICIGDVNCDGNVNAADARQLLRYIARIDYAENMMDIISIAANTADDTNNLTAADAREILRYSAGVGNTYAEWYEYHCRLEKANRYLINDNLSDA